MDFLHYILLAICIIDACALGAIFAKLNEMQKEIIKSQNKEVKLSVKGEDLQKVMKKHSSRLRGF